VCESLKSVILRDCMVYSQRPALLRSLRNDGAEDSKIEIGSSISRRLVIILTGRLPNHRILGLTGTISVGPWFSSVSSTHLVYRRSNVRRIQTEGVDHF